MPSAFWLVFLVFPILALFFGHGAFRDRKDTSEKLSAAGRTVAILGLSLGYAEIAVMVLTLATNHGCGIGRLGANEASAFGSIRTISYAASKYAEAHPNNGFPEGLERLAVPMDSSDVEWAIDPTLAKGERLAIGFAT